MISFPILKKTFKSNYKLLIIFLVILTLYFTIIHGMYDPNNNETLDALAQMKLSPELLKAMGFTLNGNTLVSFLGSYFYGFLILALPLVFNSILAVSLVAKQVEKGSMSYLLASPNSRIKVISTQALFLIICNIILILFITILGIIISSISFPGLLDIQTFIVLNIGALCLHLTLSGVAFLASCIFNDSKNAILLGTGIPLVMLLMQMLANMGGKLDFIKNFTIFTLYNASDIANGINVTGSMFILVLIAIICYTAAIAIFNKRDLSI